ncbi:hypothetical protein [Tessaracoccus palaemonis]|nr:hypothetical protein [Tessaracoccus palaemonis]
MIGSIRAARVSTIGAAWPTCGIKPRRNVVTQVACVLAATAAE